MSIAIPTKLDKRLVRQLDRLVQSGLYNSRSEAIRDGIRKVVAESYLSLQKFHGVLAEMASETIVRRFGDLVTDVILYGSVARGESDPDSDIDLLVLTERNASLKVDREIIGTLEPISLASDVVIMPLVMTREMFSRLLEFGYTFAREVVEHGIQLHGALMDEVRA